MANLMARKDYCSKSTKGKTIVGYRINFTKKGIETTGFTTDDELQITYEKNKIIITKK